MAASKKDDDYCSGSMVTVSATYVYVLAFYNNTNGYKIRRFPFVGINDLLFFSSMLFLLSHHCLYVYQLPFHSTSSSSPGRLVSYVSNECKAKSRLFPGSALIIIFNFYTWLIIRQNNSKMDSGLSISIKIFHLSSFFFFFSDLRLKESLLFWY